MKDKETRIANVGSLKVPISEVVRDARGHEDEIMEIVENDFVEGRHSNFGGWIHPVSYTHLTLPTNREV